MRRVLAARAGVNEKQAAAFLNAIQSQLVEALKNDKQVKINGLGTFKVQAVAPRKSVNVNTGEEIMIEGYSKLVFAPEAGVKELVEKSVLSSAEPTAESEQPKEIDPLKKLGAQAEEIVDILGDLGQSPKEEVKEPEPEPVAEETAVEEPVVEEPAVEEPVVVPEPEPVIVAKEPKKTHFLRDTLICVVVLLMLLLVGYFFLRHQLGNILQSLMENEDLENIPEGRIPKEQIMAEWMEASRSVSPADGKYPELITTEAMHEASRLTWMAKRYYGAKIYWPYLYDANRDVIKNANNIEVGTPIRVPKLTKLQLDTTNAETMATLERLQKEALSSGE